MNSSTALGKQLIRGPAGQLELRVDIPDDNRPMRPIAVVAHPHPLHGGTMDNKVVYCLARELAALNFAVARFNFRGVGASDGEYDHGKGEVDDLLAVVAWMRTEYPGRELWLAGFSFGGYVVARSSVECAAQHLILVAPAVTRDYFEVEAVVQSRGLIIHGTQDQLIEPDAARNWALRQPGSISYAEIKGADHFFHGKLNELRELISGYVEQVLAD